MFTPTVMTRSSLRVGLTVILAGCAGLTVATPVADAASCNYVAGAHTLVVNMPGAFDVASLSQSGGHFYIGGAPCAASATVNNTNSIFINDTTANGDGDDLVGIDLTTGPFAPGMTSEASGASEIEILLFLKRGGNLVRVTGSPGRDTLHAGRTINSQGDYIQGINLNADADPDLTWDDLSPPSSDETLLVDGDDGPDTIDASGGPGFDTALTRPITEFGSGNSDHLVGGSGQDTLYADPGNDVIDGYQQLDQVTYETASSGVTVDLGNHAPQDTRALGTDQLNSVERIRGTLYDDVLTGSDGINTLEGLGGNDVLTGRGSGDLLAGGPGNDTASYLRRPDGATTGVSVNLANPGSQDTGGAGSDTLTEMENLTGSPFADELTGDDQSNVIVGGAGKDSISAEGGPDVLAIRDGELDLATCGPGADQVTADQKGVDAVFSDCEDVSFAAALPGGKPPPRRDVVAPVIKRLKLKPRAFAAARKGPSVIKRRGTRIAYRVSEAAKVTFGVQRRRGHRKARWKRVRGRFTRLSPAGANGLRFSGRLRGRRLRRGRYRLTVFAVDAAGNRSARATARFKIVR
jgi:Ca2+-binding RTX toxin-like protein